MKLIKLIMLFILGSLCLGSGFSAVTDEDMRSNTIEFWTHDNDFVSGSTSIGSVGNYNGTINGVTTGVTGQVNESFEFDGNNDHIDIAGIENIVTKTQDYTISLWFKADSIADNIIFQTATGDNDRNIMRLSTGGNLHLNVFTGSWETNNIASTSFSDTSNWNHIVMVRDSSANTVKGYLNGVEITGTNNKGGSSSVGEN